MLQWANRIDDVHRQRTLLKSAKGCGTRFLGVASMKINSRKACGTRHSDPGDHCKHLPAGNCAQCARSTGRKK